MSNPLATQPPSTPAKFNLRALGGLPQFKAKIQTTEKTYHVQNAKDAKSTSYTVFVLTVLAVLSTTAAIVLFRYAGSPSNTVLFAPAGVFALISTGLVALCIKIVVDSICRRRKASERVQKTMNGVPSYPEIKAALSEGEVTVEEIKLTLVRLQSHRPDFLKVCVQSPDYEAKIAKAMTPSDIQSLPRELIHKKWAFGLLEHMNVKKDKEGKAFRRLQHVVGAPKNKGEKKIYARFPAGLAALCFKEKKPFTPQQAAGIFVEMSGDNQRTFLREMKNLYERKENPLEKGKVWDFLIAICKGGGQDEANSIVEYFVGKSPREFTEKILSLPVAENDQLVRALATHSKGITLVEQVPSDWAVQLLYHLPRDNQKVFDRLFTAISLDIPAAEEALALFPGYLPSKRRKVGSARMASIFVRMSGDAQKLFLTTMGGLSTSSQSKEKAPTKEVVWDDLLEMCKADPSLSTPILSHFMSAAQGKRAFVNHVLSKVPNESLAHALATKPDLLVHQDITISKEWALLLLKFIPTNHEANFKKLFNLLNLDPKQQASDETLARFPVFLANRPLSGPENFPSARLVGVLNHMTSDTRSHFYHELKKRYTDDPTSQEAVWNKLSTVCGQKSCTKEVRKEIITFFSREEGTLFLNILMDKLEPKSPALQFFVEHPDLFKGATIPRKWAVKLLLKPQANSNLLLAKQALSVLINPKEKEELEACARHPLIVADQFGDHFNAESLKMTFAEMSVVEKAYCLTKLGEKGSAKSPEREMFQDFLTPRLIEQYRDRFSNEEDSEAAPLLNAFVAWPEASAHQIFVAYPQLCLEFGFLTELMSVPGFTKNQARFTRYVAEQWEQDSSGVKNVKNLLQTYGDARADKKFDPKGQLLVLFLDILQYCPQSLAGAYPDLATQKYLPFVDDAINKIANSLPVPGVASGSESRIMTFLNALSSEARKGVIARFHTSAVLAYKEAKTFRQLRSHWIVSYFKQNPARFLSEFFENKEIGKDREVTVAQAFNLLKAMIPLRDKKIVEEKVPETAKQITAILDTLPVPKNVVQKILSTSPQKGFQTSPEWYTLLCDMAKIEINDSGNQKKKTKDTAKILACCLKNSIHFPKNSSGQDWKHFLEAAKEVQAICFPPAS